MADGEPDVLTRALAFVAEFKGDPRCALNCLHAEALAAEIYRLRADVARLSEAQEARQRELRQMFSDGVDVARSFGNKAFDLWGELLERQFQIALARLTAAPPVKESVVPFNEGDDIKGNVLRCEDCGAIYALFPLDTVLPDEQWRLIHPEDGGVLCASCIVRRAAKLPCAVLLRAQIEFGGRLTAAPKAQPEGEAKQIQEAWIELMTNLAAVRLLCPAVSEGTEP